MASKIISIAPGAAMASSKNPDDGAVYLNPTDGSAYTAWGLTPTGENVWIVTVGERGRFNVLTAYPNGSIGMNAYGASPLQNWLFTWMEGGKFTISVVGAGLTDPAAKFLTADVAKRTFSLAPAAAGFAGQAFSLADSGQTMMPWSIPPTTQAPGTQAPWTQAPWTQAPGTQAPWSTAPTGAPGTPPPATEQRTIEIGAGMALSASLNPEDGSVYTAALDGSNGPSYQKWGIAPTGENVWVVSERGKLSVLTAYPNGAIGMNAYGASPLQNWLFTWIAGGFTMSVVGAGLTDPSSKFLTTDPTTRRVSLAPATPGFKGQTYSLGGTPTPGTTAPTGAPGTPPPATARKTISLGPNAALSCQKANLDDGSVFITVPDGRAFSTWGLSPVGENTYVVTVGERGRNGVLTAYPNSTLGMNAYDGSPSQNWLFTALGGGKFSISNGGRFITAAATGAPATLAAATAGNAGQAFDVADVGAGGGAGGGGGATGAPGTQAPAVFRKSIAIGGMEVSCSLNKDDGAVYMSARDGSNGAAYQTWGLAPIGENIYVVTAPADRGKLATLGATPEGVVTMAAGDDGSGMQQWKFTALGGDKFTISIEKNLKNPTAKYLTADASTRKVTLAAAAPGAAGQAFAVTDIAVTTVPLVTPSPAPQCVPRPGGGTSAPNMPYCTRAPTDFEKQTCSKAGGTLVSRDMYGQQFAFCVFPDGSSCQVEDIASGWCARRTPKPTEAPKQKCDDSKWPFGPVPQQNEKRNALAELIPLLFGKAGSDTPGAPEGGNTLGYSELGGTVTADPTTFFSDQGGIASTGVTPALAAGIAAAAQENDYNTGGTIPSPPQPVPIVTPEDKTDAPATQSPKTAELLAMLAQSNATPAPRQSFLRLGNPWLWSIAGLVLVVAFVIYLKYGRKKGGSGGGGGAGAPPRGGGGSGGAPRGGGAPGPRPPVSSVVV